MAHHAVILAGGSGTRLWPYSTRATPKQLVTVVDGCSLLELAVARARAVVSDDRVWLCAGAEVAAAAARAGILSTDRMIVEPSGRDTLAAALLASAVIDAADRGATVLVLTADHLIEPVSAFRTTATAALEAAHAELGLLVTMGVPPDRPATGYGYLELGQPYGPGHRVSLFHEKPDLDTARGYVLAGPERYLWNSGMFAWGAPSFLEVAGSLHPGADVSARRLGDAYGTAAFADVAQQHWSVLPRTSIDFGIMEPASTSATWRLLALPLQARWLDIGSWTAFGTVLDSDDAGNATTGKVVSAQSQDCIVANSATDHVVAVWGCDNLVVVHTDRATLVVPRGRAEEVKALHAAVRELQPDYA